MPLNPPPGCFGDGPGHLSRTQGFIKLNTSSFVTYAQEYEFTLILKKDTRKAMVTLKIDVGSIPAPIVSVECLDKEKACFPVAGGMMINPTSRLAVIGACKHECEGGDLSYFWTVLPGTLNERLNYVRRWPLQLAHTI